MTPDDSSDVTVRARLSCWTCRKRKARCSRTLPACSHCRDAGQPCAYPLVQMKPGPKAGAGGGGGGGRDRGRGRRGRGASPSAVSPSSPNPIFAAAAALTQPWHRPLTPDAAPAVVRDETERGLGVHVEAARLLGIAAAEVRQLYVSSSPSSSPPSRSPVPPALSCSSVT